MIRFLSLASVDEENAALGADRAEEGVVLDDLLGDDGHLVDEGPHLEEAKDVQRALVVDHQHGRRVLDGFQLFLPLNFPFLWK